MTKHQLLRAAAFALLAAMLLSLIGSALCRPASAMSGLYNEPDHSLDVIIVGGSHVNSGTIPAILWDEYEINAYNAFGWDQTIWGGYHFIKEAFRTQSPRVVVLDLYGMTYNNNIEPSRTVDELNYTNNYLLRPGLNQLELWCSAAFVGEDRRSPLSFLPLVRYHTRWKTAGNALTETLETPPINPYTKGYSVLGETSPRTRVQWDPALPAAAPYEGCERYLNKIVDFVQAQGAQLVFTMLPYECQPSEPPIFNWLQQYADRHGIPFLNYCGPLADEIGLDYSRHLADFEHLNHYGAPIVTRHLGEYLAEHYAFPSREAHADPARLDADAQKTLRLLAVNDLPTQLDQFVEWCSRNPGTRLFLSASQTTWLSPEVRQMLQPLGLTAFEESHAFRAIWADGTVIEQASGELAVRLDLELDGFAIALDGMGNIAANDRLIRQGSGLQIMLYDDLLQKPVFHTDVHPITGALNWADCYVS